MRSNTALAFQEAPCNSVFSLEEHKGKESLLILSLIFSPSYKMFLSFNI